MREWGEVLHVICRI